MLQNVPPVHKELFTPIIHYHVEVPLPDKRMWWKHAENAGYQIPWPLPPGTDEVTTIVISKLHEAYETLGRGNFTWKTGNRYAPEVRRRHRHRRRLAGWSHTRQVLATGGGGGWEERPEDPELPLLEERASETGQGPAGAARGRLLSAGAYARLLSLASNHTSLARMLPGAAQGPRRQSVYRRRRRGASGQGSARGVLGSEVGGSEFVIV